MPSLVGARRALLFPKSFSILSDAVSTSELRYKCVLWSSDCSISDLQLGRDGGIRTQGFCLHTPYFVHKYRKEYSSLMCDFCNVRDCANEIMLKSDEWCYPFCETLRVMGNFKRENNLL